MEYEIVSIFLRNPLCALVALVLSTALEEHMAFERVFARESSATSANIRFCVVVDVLVPF